MKIRPSELLEKTEQLFFGFVITAIMLVGASFIWLIVNQL